MFLLSGTLLNSSKLSTVHCSYLIRLIKIEHGKVFFFFMYIRFFIIEKPIGQQ